MKALTVSQPYASLIASGEKWVENRRYPVSYRGPLAIHAGKGTQYLDKRELADYPTGCVIAIARLVTCVPLLGTRCGNGIWMRQLKQHGININAFLGHQHTEGPWCWILSDVRRIEPAPARGAQGLWEWEGDPDQLAQ